MIEATNTRQKLPPLLAGRHLGGFDDFWRSQVPRGRRKGAEGGVRTTRSSRLSRGNEQWQSLGSQAGSETLCLPREREREKRRGAVLQAGAYDGRVICTQT